MEVKEAEAIIEGLLFAAGDPLSLERISDILDLDKKAVKLILNNMILNFQNSKRGIMMRELNGKYQLCTRFEHNEYIKKLFEPRHKQGLSAAAFETLAIIAYNQPLTRAKVEQVRGVNSDSAVSKLLDKGLIREAGRLDAPGKPVLYETTEEFLRSFGFRSLSDLPRLEMNEVQADLEQLNGNEINKDEKQEKVSTEKPNIEENKEENIEKNIEEKKEESIEDNKTQDIEKT